MQAQGVISIGFLLFLAIAGTMMATSVFRGRRLCQELASRYPDRYAEFGEPMPGFFASARRHAYMQLVMQRKYAELDEPGLTEGFEALRKTERMQLVFMLAGFIVLGAAAVWSEFIGSP